MSNYALALLFSILFGVSTLVAFAALAGRIKFSLRTIFVIVTATCIGFAFFSAFGEDTFRVVGNILNVFLPLGNCMAVGVIFVSVMNSHGRRQAMQIGWLTPVLGMAIIDCGRLALGGDNAFSSGYLFYYPMVYVTAWLAGAVCERTYQNAQSQHPLRGTYRERSRRDTGSDGTPPANSQYAAESVQRASVRSPFAGPIDDEPSVYKID